MLRINKMTDYAVTLLCTMAQAPTLLYSCQHLTEVSNIALPAVSQILKKLCQNQMVDSIRGPKGGYKLRQLPSEVCLADVIQIMEGPMSMTECGLGACQCELENSCELKSSWAQINLLIKRVLGQISLVDMNQQALSQQYLEHLFTRRANVLSNEESLHL